MKVAKKYHLFTCLSICPLETVLQGHCEGVPACGRQETTEAISQRIKPKRLPRLRAGALQRAGTLSR